MCSLNKLWWCTWILDLDGWMSSFIFSLFQIVLEEAGRPMHIKEIKQRIIDRGLVQSKWEQMQHADLTEYLTWNAQGDSYSKHFNCSPLFSILLCSAKSSLEAVMYREVRHCVRCSHVGQIYQSDKLWPFICTQCSICNFSLKNSHWTYVCSVSSFSIHFFQLILFSYFGYKLNCIILAERWAAVVFALLELTCQFWEVQFQQEQCDDDPAIGQGAVPAPLLWGQYPCMF